LYQQNSPGELGMGVELSHDWRYFDISREWRYHRYSFFAAFFPFFIEVYLSASLADDEKNE
jgi:hypothetical protein